MVVPVLLQTCVLNMWDMVLWVWVHNTCLPVRVAAWFCAAANVPAMVFAAGLPNYGRRFLPCLQRGS